MPSTKSGAPARVSLLVLSVFGAHVLSAQSPLPSEPRDEPAPIEDNSFLVEEAYNQGRGVVQHVGTFFRARGSEGWMFSFTQEWPLFGRTHQLSYSLPVARVGEGSARETGVGDVALNYRYQIGAGEDDSFAFAPRATVLVPTGSSSRGLGSGGTGFQVNLPLSVQLPAGLVAHSNAGATYTPRARDTFGNSAATRSLALGQSVIWLAHPRLNFMLEATWTRGDQVTGPRQTVRTTETLLSPGVRAAIDFASGLQIVPGIAFPFGIGSSRGERGVFLYLSFEHPFGKTDP